MQCLFWTSSTFHKQSTVNKALISDNPTYIDVFMLLRRGFPAVAVWLSSFSRPTLSLPTSGFAGALSPADTTLAERLTSIFEQRPHSQAIPLSESAIASLGLAEAAVLSQAAYCKSVRDLYWTCGKACSSYPDMYIQWSAGTSQKVPYSELSSLTGFQARYA